ncbi:spore germination protein [Mesobacillus zeae]|uniref:spore germination protein n=1 Tax=Mesobacillus zeae TaxID=1917180 RepID=UPI0015E7115C|nr:spore germination protein [Mesobacillus zeae]
MDFVPFRQEIKAKEELLHELTKGSVVISSKSGLQLFYIKKVNTNIMNQTSVETTILGPQLSLSEDIQTNINLVQQRYHQPSLTAEMFETGEKSHQSVAFLYDSDTVSKDVLQSINQSIKEKIIAIDKTIVQSAAALQMLLNGRKRSLLSTMMVTERTDRIVYNLAGGKVVILIDGNPSSVITPIVFFDFMTSMEDNYRSYFRNR